MLLFCTVVFAWMMLGYSPGRTIEVDPDRITEPGKIWVQDDLLAIVDNYRGVHLFSVSDYSNPKRLSFINVPDAVDLAIKGDALYVNSSSTLMVYNISNKSAPVRVRSISNACTYVYAPGSYNYYEDDDYWSCSGEDDAAASTSQGGSMARFSIVGDWLYVLKYATVKVFDISSPFNPDSYGEFNTSWTVETVFAYQDYLFLGANDGVHIFSITNRAVPAFVTQFTHVRSYDPVVVQGNYAFVTLRNLWWVDDGGPNSRLEVYQVNQVTNMTKLAHYGLDNPYGLAASGDQLYICDGFSGLRIYDISNPESVVRRNTVSGPVTYDVIRTAAGLVVSAGEGVYLYDLTDPWLPGQKSKLQ